MEHQDLLTSVQGWGESVLGYSGRAGPDGQPCTMALRDIGNARIKVAI